MQFVYDPHIVPAIDRWKAEYQAARRRRREEELYATQVEVQMTQTQTRGSRKASNDGSSDDDEPPSLGSGKPVDGKFATSSLLLRRPGSNSPQKGEDVELDNLVAREVSEWRNENSLQVLRQRKNISEHAMDGVILPLFYYNVPYILTALSTVDPLNSLQPTLTFSYARCLRPFCSVDPQQC